MRPAKPHAVIASAILISCATGPVSPLTERERAEVAQLAAHPLPEFLARWYTKSTGPVTSVRVSPEFKHFYYTSLKRPRALLEEYCTQNRGSLYRQPSQQMGWSDTSPEAFADPRTAGRAELSLRGICEPSYLNPGCGAAKASKEGAFGTFQCRAREGDKLLWFVTVEGSVGRILPESKSTAVMDITITPRVQ